MPEVLLQGGLALVCLACACYLGRARAGHDDADQPALFCALLGFVLPGAAAVAALLGDQPDARAAQLWLSQASAFLGLPLLALAALTLGRGWAWSRAAWGRALLGLCAGFELARQLDRLAPYGLLIEIASLLLVLHAGAVQWPRQRLPLLLGGAVMGLWLLATRLDVLPALLLSLAYPLLAGLIVALPGYLPEKNPAKTL